MEVIQRTIETFELTVFVHTHKTTISISVFRQLDLFLITICTTFQTRVVTARCWVRWSLGGRGSDRNRDINKMNERNATNSLMNESKNEWIDWIFHIRSGEKESQRVIDEKKIDFIQMKAFPITTTIPFFTHFFTMTHYNRTDLAFHPPQSVHSPALYSSPALGSHSGQSIQCGYQFFIQFFYYYIKLQNK